MENTIINHFTHRTAIFWLLALPVIYFISRFNYNLFHSFADGATIVIAASAFTIIWNSRHRVDNDYFLYTGIAFLFFAFLDAMHLLGNKNMGVFPEYGNLGPTFYIASRYILSISLLTAPLFINRKLNATLMLAVYSLITLLILLSIFYWKIFPVCIVEGVGLTPFKVISDYIICLILLGSIGLLLINRQSFDSRVLSIIVFSIIMSIATGLTFTLYTDPFGITNMVGHFFQLASFYLVYLAFIETSLNKPQEILFRKLKQNEEKLTRNLQQLDDANVELNQEIAERNRAEEELRKNQEWLRVTLSSIGDAVLASDRERRITFLNPVAEELTGWKLEGALGQPVQSVFRIIDGQTRSPREDIIGRVLREERIVALANHTVLIAHDGREIPIEDSAAPINDISGKVSGVVLVFHDVTEKRRAQEALQASESKYRNLFENMTEEVHFWQVVRDEAGRIETWRLVDANPPTLKTWGRTSVDEIKGKTTDEILGPGATEHYLPIVQKIMTEGVPYSFEDYFPNLDRYFRFTSVPLEDYFITTGADITGIKKTEQALRNAHDELELRVQERTLELAMTNKTLRDHTAKLERLNKELEEFAWISAHDLQEPLRKIQTYGSRLDQMKESLNPKGQQDLLLMIKSANRMGSLVRALKNYSEATREEHSFRPIDLSKVIEDVVSDLEMVIQEAEARIEVSVLPSLQVDRTGFRQLFQNLIGNSIKYAKENEKPVVRITSRIDNGMCQIYLEDNGIGFDEQYLLRIFRPFQRLHGRSSRYDGTGMGLAICRKVVERHGGTITARSSPGKGSTFIISLPLKQGVSERASHII